MGGAGSGRPRDLDRRRQALELRHQGYSLEQVARALGVSRQAASGMLHRCGAGIPQGHVHLRVQCCRCGVLLCVGEFHAGTGRTALCLPCLDKLPSPKFGQRVRAYRLAKGWPMKQLARELGVALQTISEWERSKHVPLWKNLERLFRALGVRWGGGTGRTREVECRRPLAVCRAVNGEAYAVPDRVS